jgi:hypothetical protein
MEENLNTAETLVGRIGDYGRASYKVIRLKAVDKTAELVASLLSNAIIFLTFLLFALMVSCGVSFLLGEWMGRIGYGFLFVAAFYGVLSLMMYFVFRDKIKKRVANRVISQLLK